MLLNTAEISHPPEKNIQIRVHHLCWEDCSHTSRHTSQGLATGFCSLCPLHTLFHKAQVHRGISALFVSALCSSMEIPGLTLFQICGLKVPGKYKLLYSKAQELFLNTKCSIYFCVMKTRHKAEWAACIFWDLRSIASSFSQWTSCLRVTRIVPEQRPLSWILEDFIQDAIVCLRF